MVTVEGVADDPVLCPWGGAAAYFNSTHRLDFDGVCYWMKTITVPGAPICHEFYEEKIWHLSIGIYKLATTAPVIDCAGYYTCPDCDPSCTFQFGYLYVIEDNMTPPNTGAIGAECTAVPWSEACVIDCSETLEALEFCFTDNFSGVDFSGASIPLAVPMYN